MVKSGTSMAGCRCVTEAATPPRLSNKWLLLALLVGIATFNFGDRFLLAALAKPVQAEFHASDSLMGLLMGPSFAILYATLALPIARYADRTSRIKVICAGCAVWSLFTLTSGLASSAAMLAIGRIGVGVGEAAFQAPAYSLIAASFPREQRGRAFSGILLSTYAGQLLGYVGGPAIAAASSWRMAFYAMGAGGLIMAALAILIVREPPAPVKTDETPPLLPLLMKLCKTPAFVILTAGYTLGVLSGVAFGQWAPTLFQRAYDVSATVAGQAIGGAMILPGVVGALSFGFIADTLVKRGIGRAVMLSVAALTAATLATLAVTWMPSLKLASIAAVPAGLLGGGWAVGVLSGFQYLFPDRIRSTANAMAMMIGILVGFAGGPWLVGQFSDMFGGDTAESLRMAMTIVIPLGLVGAALIALSIKRLDDGKARLAEL